MLKYSHTTEEGTFSPTHRNNADPLMKETIDVTTNPRSRAKMVMKKRAKQKRGHDFSLFPPITNTPSRKDVPTPYINGNDLENPYINALGITRITDVTTPYIMHSTMGKTDVSSPVPPIENHMDFRKEYTRVSQVSQNNKEYTRVSQMSHNNVVEVTRKNDHSRSIENLHKMGSSPYIERRSRLEFQNKNGRKNMERHNTTIDNDKTAKLQIHSNQMGLVQRTERQRTRDSRLGNSQEPFSIRKKIEQFRKWHEEHYKDKLKKLKEEVNHQFEEEHRKLQKSRLGESPSENEKVDSKNEKKFLKDVSMPLTSSNGQTDATAKIPPQMHEEHTPSEHTWHTWRDVNDSYAYSDVQKYIDDNDLMGKEKEDWIKKWITEVETALQIVSSEENLT